MMSPAVGRTAVWLMSPDPTSSNNMSRLSVTCRERLCCPCLDPHSWACHVISCRCPLIYHRCCSDILVKATPYKFATRIRQRLGSSVLLMFNRILLPTSYSQHLIQSCSWFKNPFRKNASKLQAQNQLFTVSSPPSNGQISLQLKHQKYLSNLPSEHH